MTLDRTSSATSAASAAKFAALRGIGLESIPGMVNNKEELKDRVEAKRHQLQAKLAELRADSRSEARDAGAKMKAKLDEIEEDLKDGWDRVSENVSAKLNRWLEKD